jgi:hypothetical protein
MKWESIANKDGSKTFRKKLPIFENELFTASVQQDNAFFGSPDMKYTATNIGDQMYLYIDFATDINDDEICKVKKDLDRVICRWKKVKIYKKTGKVRPHGTLTIGKLFVDYYIWFADVFNNLGKAKNDEDLDLDVKPEENTRIPVREPANDNESRLNRIKEINQLIKDLTKEKYDLIVKYDGKLPYDDESTTLACINGALKKIEDPIHKIIEDITDLTFDGTDEDKNKFLEQPIPETSKFICDKKWYDEMVKEIKEEEDDDDDDDDE